jgi:hypothetical protein
VESLRDAILERLRVHPRLSQQPLALGADVREKLLAALPPLSPFRREVPREIVAVLDWDHRLPSQRMLLRLHLNYAEASCAAFATAWDERNALIARRDLFPEFDVPDYDDLPADERYEAEMTLGIVVDGMRLTSAWRREIEPSLAARAVELARASPEFARVCEGVTARAPHLGDLEPVSWMPPCESGHPAWTIDVWWLTEFDGRAGAGWSFLVEIEAPGGGAAGQVVTHREFSVRAG